LAKTPKTGVKKISSTDFSDMVQTIYDQLKAKTKREYIDKDGVGVIVFYNRYWTVEEAEDVRDQAISWLDQFGYRVNVDFDIRLTDYNTDIFNSGFGVAWAVWMKDQQDFSWLKIHDR
jgi:hypothetical protein